MTLTYEQAVKEKMVRQQEAGFNSFEKIMKSSEKISTILKNKQDHDFQQTFYIQDNYENKQFLGFSYKKLIGKNVIPIGLCEVCNKLEVEHNE